MEKEWVKEYKDNTNLKIKNVVVVDKDLEFEPKNLLEKAFALINQIIVLYLYCLKSLIVFRFEHFHKLNPIFPRSVKKKGPTLLQLIKWI